MNKRRRGENFQSLLQKRLEENKKLYGDPGFLVLDNPLMRFAASYLGVNPWKILVPAAFVLTLAMRLILGPAYSETVLRILGGR